MDISIIGINAISIPSPRSTLLQSTGSPTGSYTRSMSPAYRARCRLKGHCVHYSAHDHWVEECLLQPFTKQISMEALCNQRLESDLDIDKEIGRLQRGEI